MDAVDLDKLNEPETWYRADHLYWSGSVFLSPLINPLGLLEGNISIWSVVLNSAANEPS